MLYPKAPKKWRQLFREGDIYEREYFYGLIYCAKFVPVEEILVVLDDEERGRLVQLLGLLASIAAGPGQMVSGVAPFELEDAGRLLKELEA